MNQFVTTVLLGVKRGRYLPERKSTKMREKLNHESVLFSQKQMRERNYGVKLKNFINTKKT